MSKTSLHPLEARIAPLEVESQQIPIDFDGASWFWMIVLCIALPIGLLAAGWWFAMAPR